MALLLVSENRIYCTPQLRESLFSSGCFWESTQEKNCRNIRNARGFDHTTLLLLPSWNSHLFCHPVQATEVHEYITMNYPYCNLIPGLSRSLVFILGQQRRRVIQWPTRCMFLGGTGVRSGGCGRLPSLLCWTWKWCVCMGEGIRAFGHATVPQHCCLCASQTSN